ncbi:MAG: nickel pincer cofactor biosynthesis protein LarC [Methanospirillum sp.]
MKVLVIDPRTSGIAGDMLLAALVDLLGSDEALSPVAEAIRNLDACRGLSYAFRRVETGGAMQLDLRIDEDPLRDGDGLRDAAVSVAAEAGLSRAGTATALRTLDDLLAAEARLHGDGFRDHAIASIDTLFDILGAVRLLEAGGFLDGEVYGLPPALGGGVMDMPCGPLAIPAPATVEVLCRHQAPWSSVPAATELTTPTGAALFANVAARVTEVFPAMTPVRTGYGVGTRPGSGWPGGLRVVEGTNFHGVADRIVMLETNLDDVSGEVVGYTIERLREAGAVDVFVTPAYGKKNRPVQVLHVITGPADYERLLAILMEESGTLGVRVLDQPRLVAERRREARTVTVGGRKFEVQVKTSTVDGRVVAVKAEYEDLRRIARELGRPLRSIDDEVRAALGGLRES